MQSHPLHRQQESALKKILKHCANNEYFTELRLDKLTHLRNFEYLYKAFKQTTPIISLSQWCNFYHTTNQNWPEDQHIINQGRIFLKNVLSKYKISPAQSYVVFPFLSIDKSPWPPPPATSFWGRNPLQNQQKLQTEGRSQFQLLHAFARDLEENGHKVRALIGPANVLCQLSMFIAQKKGRFTPLDQLCPHLEVLIITNMTRNALHETEIKLWAQDANITYEHVWLHETGLMAQQEKTGLDQAPMLPWLTQETLLEFIPAEDVNPDSTPKRQAKRFLAHQLSPHKYYNLIVTNVAGLAAVQTPFVFEVLGDTPLKLRYVYQYPLLEAGYTTLADEDIANCIAEINKLTAQHGLFVRDFKISPQPDKSFSIILEINQNPQDMEKDVLKGHAQRLLSDLINQNPKLEPILQSQQVVYVPKGCLAEQTLPSKPAHHQEHPQQVALTIQLDV